MEGFLKAGGEEEIVMMRVETFCFENGVAETHSAMFWGWWSSGLG